MALSFCSNHLLSYPSLNQNLNQDTVVFPQRKRPRSSSSTLSFSDSHSFNNVEPLILQTNNNNDIIHHNSFFSNPINDNNTLFSALSPQTLFPLEYDDDQDYCDYNNNNNLDYSNYYADYPEFFFNNGQYSPNYTGFIPECDTQYDNFDHQMLLAPLLEEPHENNYMVNYGYNNNYNQEMVTGSSDHHELKKTKSTSSAVVSPQSIAARERRRKITEKTQELGKLIPGGNKMSTAEMFQAASKYVKFLQAQVAVLQDMKEEALNIKELQVLASPIIQERLYSEEKCLVPKEFVDRTSRSNSFGLEEFESLMQNQ